MKCFKCGGRTKVVESRWRENRKYKYRKRICIKCGEETSTVEIPLEKYRKVMKLNNFVNGLR